MRSNVSDVAMEYFTRSNAISLVRMIVFEQDEDTGAKCVYDILEADYNPGRSHWMTRQAVSYTEDSNLDVQFKFRFTPTDEVAPDTGADYRTSDEIDTVSVNLESKIIRAMQQMVA